MLFNNNNRAGTFINISQGNNLFGNNTQQPQNTIFGGNQQQQQGIVFIYSLRYPRSLINLGNSIFGGNQQQQQGTNPLFANQQQQQGNNLFGNQASTYLLLFQTSKERTTLLEETSNNQPQTSLE